ncbi:retrovirus-related pol polyprotein from transposon TNT 1-94, partial [Tanacetum coccineum]
QKASDYDNSDLVPPRQNVVPTVEKTDSSQQGLEFLFSPLLEEYYNPAHGHAEDNNNGHAPNVSFQEDEFINPFCTRVQEIGESSSRNIDNTDFKQDDSLPQILKCTIDPTLFKIKYGEDILLVQIYVDDIIFGSTNPKYSKRFEKLMHSRFEMSLMGEMKFFLGLQIHQSPKGIFINQAKYALEILKKHNMDNCHSIGTPLATKPKLDVDLSVEPIDQSDYRSKIGSLVY